MSEQVEQVAHPTIEAIHSPGIGAIAAALARAQGQMTGAKKDTANPFFGSVYADLASVWDACRAALSANELAVVQLPEASSAVVTVTTVLVHSSGEWFRSVVKVPVTGTSKKDREGSDLARPPPITAQSVGSAITYARRYALSAMVGVAPDDDDDGNKASGREGNGFPSRRQEPAPYSPPPTGKRTADVKAHLAARTQKAPEVVTSPVLERIRELGKRHGKEGKELSDFVREAGVKAKPAELAEEDFKKVEAAFVALVKSEPPPEVKLPTLPGGRKMPLIEEDGGGS